MHASDIFIYAFFFVFLQREININKKRYISMKKFTSFLFLVTFATALYAQTTAPAFSTVEGTYYNPFSIELTGSNIYYTIDGTTPTVNSTKYTEAISISEFGTSTTIKAASYSNNTWSDVVTATYELKVAAPVFSTKGGVYEKVTGNAAVKFTTETTSATVYYNDRGKDPKTEGSKLYGSLSVLSTTTINAVAFVKNEKGENIYSEVVSEYYAISPIALFASANEISDGKYIINYGSNVASSFYKHIEDGNLNTRSVANAKGKYIETNEFDGFTFTGVNGGYTIQDAYDRYLYMSDNNTLSASSSKPSTGEIWSITINNATALATIKNVTKGKTIAYDTDANAFGLFAEIDEHHALPYLYKATEYPTITITPADGDTIREFSEFTVYCESGLDYTETNKLYTYFNVGQDNTKHEFDDYEFIDDNTILFYLEEPVISSDDYKIIFPAGVFTIDPNGLAKTNKEIIARYTVANNDILELTYANPSNKETTNSLQYLYFEFNQAIDRNITGAVLTDKQGNEYPLTLSEIDSWGSVCLENALCLMTEAPVTTSGEYTFVLKKEYATATANNELTIEKDITYRFTVEEALKINSITPNSSDIYDEVSEIAYTFNKAVLHNNITEIIVKDSNNNSYTFTKTTADEESNSLTFATTTPLTNAGTYTFTLEGNVIYCENPNSDINEIESIPETTFTFIVKYPTSSIEDINAASKEAATYDLTGRQIEKITNAGIYIINGKKVVVK